MKVVGFILLGVLFIALGIMIAKFGWFDIAVQWLSNGKVVL